MAIDLTGQPNLTPIHGGSQQAGGLAPDNLLLQRYTREVERLGKQAQPTSEMARALQQAVEHTRRLNRELASTADAVSSLSRSLREAFQETIQAIRQSASGLRTGGGTGASSAGVSGSTLLTAAAIATIGRQILTTPAVQSQLRTAQASQSSQAATPFAYTPIPSRTSRKGKGSMHIHLTDEEEQLAQSLPLEGINASGTPGVPLTPINVPTVPPHPGMFRPEEMPERPEGPVFSAAGKIRTPKGGYVDPASEKGKEALAASEQQMKDYDISLELWTESEAERQESFNIELETYNRAVIAKGEAERRIAEEAAKQQQTTPTVTPTEPDDPDKGKWYSTRGKEAERAEFGDPDKRSVGKSMRFSMGRETVRLDRQLKEAQTYGGMLDAGMTQRTGGTGDAAQLFRRRQQLAELQRRNVALTSSVEARFQNASMSTEGGAEDVLETRRRELQARSLQARTSAHRGRIEEGLRGGPEHRRMVTNEASLELQNNTRNLRDQVDAARTKDRLMSSPQGKAALREEVQLQRQLGTFNRAQQFRQLSAEVGPFSAYLMDANMRLDSFRQSLEGIGSIGGRIFTIGSAGILSMVQAADPITFQTFKRSIEDLAAAIGTAFIPVVQDAAAWIQRATARVDSMDDATKQNIARWAAYGVAIAGATIVLPRFVALGTAAIAVLRGMGIAAMWIVANPWVLGLTAIALAVGHVTGAFDRMGTMVRSVGRDIGLLGDRGAIDGIRRIGGAADRPTVTPEFTAALGATGRHRAGIEGVGADPAAIRRAVEAATISATTDVTAARTRLAASGGATVAAREEEIRIAEQLFNRARDIAFRPVSDILQARPFAGGLRGEALDQAVEGERRRAAHRAVLEAGETGRIPALDAGIQANIIDRLTRAMSSGYTRTDIVPGSGDAREIRRGHTVPPEVSRAQQALDAAIRVSEALQRITGLIGGSPTGTTRETRPDLMLSLRGQLPPVQMFQDFAQYGEQLTMKTLEGNSLLDIQREMRTIINVLETLGITAGTIATNTDVSRMWELFNPTGGR